MNSPAAPTQRVLCALLLLGVVLTWGLLGTSAAAQPSPAPGTSTVAPPSPGQSSTERGVSLYSSSCASCHGQAGEGTQRGPSLAGVGEASVDFQLQTGRMPLDEEKASPPSGRPAFGQEDIEALVAHVAAFGGDGPSIPTVRPGDLTTGRELYLQNCAACHSSGGTGYTQVGGRRAPSLMQSDPVQMAEAIRVGPGLMPHFPQEVLSDEYLNAVVTYVQELQRLDGKGGADLGRIGPVTETLVGFAGVAVLLVVVRRLGKRAP